jgi:hypothetical protein
MKREDRCAIERHQGEKKQDVRVKNYVNGARVIYEGEDTGECREGKEN